MSHFKTFSRLQTNRSFGTDFAYGCFIMNQSQTTEKDAIKDGEDAVAPFMVQASLPRWRENIYSARCL